MFKLHSTKLLFFLSSGGMHFFSDIFSLLSLGHRVTRQGHYGFLSHLASLQGHLNLGIFSSGHQFSSAFLYLLFLGTSSQGPEVLCRKYREEQLVFFWPQFSNGAIYWPFGKPYSWIALITINWFFSPLLREKKNFCKWKRRHLSWP